MLLGDETLFPSGLAKTQSWRLVCSDSLARDSSTVSKMYLSRQAFRFKAVKSTHILTSPFFLGTGTIPAHHSVRPVTLEITPTRSITFNSAITGC